MKGWKPRADALGKRLRGRWSKSGRRSSPGRLSPERRRARRRHRSPRPPSVAAAGSSRRRRPSSPLPPSNLQPRQPRRRRRRTRRPSRPSSSSTLARRGGKRRPSRVPSPPQPRRRREKHLHRQPFHQSPPRSSRTPSREAVGGFPTRPTTPPPPCPLLPLRFSHIRQPRFRRALLPRRPDGSFVPIPLPPSASRSAPTAASAIDFGSPLRTPPRNHPARNSPKNTPSSFATSCTFSFSTTSSTPALVPPPVARQTFGRSVRRRCGDRRARVDVPRRSSSLFHLEYVFPSRLPSSGPELTFDLDTGSPLVLPIDRWRLEGEEDAPGGPSGWERGVEAVRSE